MKVAAIIEARMTSTRLPGKHLKKILGKPVLELLIERLKLVEELDEIVLACTKNKEDDVLERLALKLGIKCFRGSESDVLQRVLKAAQSIKADIIVETLGDCPLTCPKIIAECLNIFLESNYDYVANALIRTYPDGFDVQIYPTNILAKADKLTRNPFDREHVTLFIYNHPEMFKINNIKATGELFWPDLAVTLDTKEDFWLIKKIFENLYPLNPKFTGLDVVKFLRSNSEFLDINKRE